MKRLSSRQKAFCREFMVDGNATKAAERAGYSPKTAKFQASRLLTFVNVQETLFKLQEEARKNAEISREEVLKELAAMLRSKITDYLSFDGKVIRFKDFSTLSETQIKAVEAVKETKWGIELKLHGKAWTVERICKILGFDSPAAIDLNIDRMDEATLDLIIHRLIDKGNEQ
jgi:phage terminase small subunit